MLETLLLLSCRDLGVDFVLIDNDNDDKKKHVAMEKIMCEVDIAFDATGNQFSMNEPVSESIDEKKNNTQVSTHWTDRLFATGWPYDLMLEPPHFVVDYKTSRYSPITNDGHPYKLTMTKILGIPLRVKETLAHLSDGVCGWVTCGQFYLFQGSLPIAVNSMVLLVGLRKADIITMSKIFENKNVPNGILLSDIPLDMIDFVEPQFGLVLRYLIKECGNTCRISSAFDYDPYLYSPALYPSDSPPNWKSNSNSQTRSLVMCKKKGQTKWLRIGDSCWIGDPTLSSGLGKHLQMVREVVSEIKLNMFKTEHVACSMQEN